MAIDKANSERIVPRMPKQSSPAVPFLKVQRSPTKKRRITYNVQAIQSLSGVKGIPLKRGPTGALAGQGYIPATGATMTPRELTAQQVADIFPFAENPIASLLYSGVTYYSDPLIRGGGYYDPSTNQLHFGSDANRGVFGHELTHAVQDLQPWKFGAASAFANEPANNYSKIVEIIKYGSDIGRTIGNRGMLYEKFATAVGGYGAYRGNQPADIGSTVKSVFGTSLGTFRPSGLSDRNAYYAGAGPANLDTLGEQTARAVQGYQFHQPNFFQY